MKQLNDIKKKNNDKKNPQLAAPLKVKRKWPKGEIIEYAFLVAYDLIDEEENHKNMFNYNRGNYVELWKFFSDIKIGRKIWI